MHKAPKPGNLSLMNREANWASLVAGAYVTELAKVFATISAFINLCNETGDFKLVISDGKKDGDSVSLPIEADDFAVGLLITALDGFLSEMEQDSEAQGINGFCDHVQRSFLLSVRQQLGSSPLMHRAKLRDAVFDWIEKAEGKKV